MSRLQIPSFLNKIVLKDQIEPRWTWALRLAFATVMPIVYGVANDCLKEAEWAAIVAEAICWVELKGSNAQRLRLLFGAVLVVIITSIAGTFLSAWPIVSIIAMFFITAMAAMFRNMGDRGSALSFTMLIAFIVTNATPITPDFDWPIRMQLLLYGCLVAVGVTLITFLFNKKAFPYRQSITQIWITVNDLATAVLQGWDLKAPRTSAHQIFLKEKALRQSVNNSLQFFETLADEVSRTDTVKYALAQSRKSAALVGSHLMAIVSELEHITIKSLQPQARILFYEMIKIIGQLSGLMASYVLNESSEDELLIKARVERIQNIIALLDERDELLIDEKLANRLKVLLGRIAALVLNGVEHANTGHGTEEHVLKSYSLVKTLYILHPKHIVRSLRIIFSVDTLSAKYMLRMGLAGAVAAAIWKLSGVKYGYWIPLTTAIIVQPYIGATIKKAIDRSLGTVLGGIVGGLLIMTSTVIQVQEVALFISSILMVYFVNKRYPLAVFFITISTVLLFEMSDAASPLLIIDRASNTMIGSVLAVLAGFVFFPTWDRKYFITYVEKAIVSNAIYFNKLIENDEREPWTKYKRRAETDGVNAFDSFNRYVQEPSIEQKNVKTYYLLVSHLIRITRELTYIKLEGQVETKLVDKALIIPRIEYTSSLFYSILQGFKVETNHIPLLDVDHLENVQMNEIQQFHLEKLILELEGLQIDLGKYHQLTTR